MKNAAQNESSPPLRRHAAKRTAAVILWGLVVLLQASLLAWHATWWWAARNNTLFGNGRWISGKDTGKFVFYSYGFLFRPLRHSQVNLTRDMGYQEIIYAPSENTHRRLTALNAQVHVARGGYLWIELHKDHQCMLACRVSRNSRYPSGFYLFDSLGEVTRYVPMPPNSPRPGDGWTTVTLQCTNHIWRLALDGKSAGSFPDQSAMRGRLGFKGSGNPRADVRIKNIHMTFVDPLHPGRSWTEVEKFSTRRLVRRFFPAVFALSIVLIGLRYARLPILCGLLSDQAVHPAFIRRDAATLTVILGALALIHPPPSGVALPAALLAAELASVVLLITMKKDASAPVYAGKSRPIVIWTLLLMLLGVLAFGRTGETLGRPSDVRPDKLAGIHPAAYVTFPDPNLPSRPFSLPAQVTITPGKPLFITNFVYRQQHISIDFLIPTNRTLDIVFQQQAYCTRGDPHGEPLPLQRRLIRLSTRNDVPTGFSTRTGNRPAPFLSIKGTLLPDETNHLEIISDNSGVRVILNGKDTFLPRRRPLGYGETGLMAYHGPIIITRFNVTPLADAVGRHGGMYAAGAILPLIWILGAWVALYPWSRFNIKTAAALSLPVLYLPAAYCLAAIFIGRESLEYMGRSRLIILDTSLLAAAVLLPAMIILARRRIRAAVALFNIATIMPILAAGLLVWDNLPERHPLRLRFTANAVAPGEIIKGNRGREGPWYTNNRWIGASTYVWRQQFGGENLTIPKPPRVVRVFLVGGSQAWGSGASDSRHTFAELLENLLRNDGLPVEVYNAGVNGAGMTKILEYYRQLIRRFQPDILLADMGLNDSAVLAQKKSQRSRRKHVALLVKFFEQLLRECRRDHTTFVLCLEPMSAELGLRPDPDYYRAMAAATHANGGYVVDPSSEIRRKEHDHLVWWDTAHLAPYGHRLLAHLLEPTVARAVHNRIHPPPHPHQLPHDTGALP